MTPPLPPDVEPVEPVPRAPGPIFVIVVGAMLALCAVAFATGLLI